jgi:hypothetical protein
MIETTGYILLCCLLGWPFLRCFLNTENHFYVSITALPIGVAISIVLAFFYMLLPLPYTFGYLSALFGVSSVLLLFFSIMFFPLKREETVSAAVCFVGISIVGACFHSINLTSFSPDSFGFIKSALNFVELQDHKLLISDASIFYKLLHSFAVLLKKPYFIGLTPAVGVCLLITLAAYLYTHTLQANCSRQLALIISTALVVFFLLTLHTQAQFFYSNNHLFTACYLTLAVIFFVKGIDLNSSKLVYLAAICLGLASFSRVETNLYGVILLLLFVSNDHLTKATQIKTSLIYGAVAMWHPLILLLDSPGSTYGTYPLLLLVMTPFFCAAFYALTDIPIVQWLHRSMHILLPWMLIIALVVAFLLKGEHMQVSAQRFFYNLFIDGLWGSFWWVCVTALIIQLFYYKKVSDLTMRFMLSVFLVVLLTFLLSYLRTPYRLGWTDSGNRIVFHIAPVVLLWLASLWKDLLVIGHKKRTT